jgi:hypothetical protein
MQRSGTAICRHLLLLLGLAALASSCGAFQTLGSSQYTRELQMSGVPAQAAVLSMQDTLESINDNPIVRLLVEVRPTDRPPYQATIEHLVITTIQAFQFQPGKIIAVRYDPRNPSRVAVDPGR